MKKSNIIFSISLLILIAIVIYYYLLPKEQKSFEVCYAPNNCKTVTGAGVEDIKSNIIGYPNNYHQENSIKHIDSIEDFKKGRFDEKAFYFSSNNKVFYFINAKIPSGFSEDAGEILNSDAKTFEIIDANFSRDKKQVYARPDLETPIANTIIEGADPKSFETLDFPCARDKNNYYKFSQIVNEDECK